MSPPSDDNSGQFSQRGLFESHSSSERPTLYFPDLTDADKNNLEVCVLALESLQGVGFKTIRALWDNGIVYRLATQEHGIGQLPAAPLLHQQELAIQEAFQDNRDRLLQIGARSAEELAHHQIWFAPVG